MAKRLVQLDKAQLEGFNARIDSMRNLSPAQRKAVKASMLVAANPEAESPEYGIASLPVERRKIADKSVKQSAEIFGFSYNFQVDFDEQQEFNEALNRAKADGQDKLEWAIVLALLYFFLFPKEQERSLYESIESAYIQAWQLAIKEQAARYGCPNARIGSPSGASLREIRKLARRDSNSIAKTYDGDAQRALRKLYEANPLGAVNYYLTGMAEWANSRQMQHNLTISITNVQNGYMLGVQDFMMNNRVETGYRLVGAPPVCPTCTYLTGLGEVSIDVVLSYGFGLIHINCPHTWQSTRTYQIPCGSMWTGV